MTSGNCPFHENLNKENLEILINKLRPLSLSELTPIIYNLGLAHSGSQASKYSTHFTLILSKMFFVLT